MKTWINNNSSREILKSRVLQCTAKSNRVESLLSLLRQHSTASSRSHEKGYRFSKTQSYGNGKKCVLERTRPGRQETTLFPVLFHYKCFKILLLYFQKYLGFKNLRPDKNEKIGCMLHCFKIEFNFLLKKFSKHLLHNIVAYDYIVK